MSAAVAIDFPDSHYDSGIGRFIQEDPVAGVITRPSSLVSKYIYSINNPINILDPSGRFVITSLVVGAIVGGILNEALDMPFSLFEGMLLGAVSGYSVGYTMAGVGAGGGSIGAALGLSGGVKSAIGFVVGSSIGFVSAGLFSKLILGGVLGDEEDKRNSQKAGLIGLGAGLASAFAVSFYNAPIENMVMDNVLGRISVMTSPTQYVMTYPADAIVGGLYLAGEFLCDGMKLPDTGGSCEF